MVKNAFVIIMLFTMISGFIGCNNDDFAPYKKYEKNIDINIDIDLSSIDDITNEVTKISQKYEDGAILTNAIIELNGSEQINNCKGTILFDFIKEHESKNKITKVLLSYDMSAKKLNKLRFEQGHGKRVSGYSAPINKELSKIQISKLISDLYNDSEFQQKKNFTNQRLEVNYTHEINIRLYDNMKNEGPIYWRKIENGFKAVE